VSDEQATAVINTAAIAQRDDDYRSPLLNETLSYEPFSAYFESTWLGGTRSTVNQESAVAHLEWRTPTLTDEMTARRQAPSWKPTTTTPSRDPNDDRLILLARKYALKDGFSEEQRARLAIVTERVRQLLPAVTLEEVQTLEAALNVLREATDSDREIREGLQLNAPPRKGA
jgi:hypothetical protein